MTFTRSILRFSSIVALSLLAACSSATVASNKSPSYAGGFKRLFIEANLGTALGKKRDDAENQFKSALTDGFAKCGIVVQIHQKNPVSLDPNETKELVGQFHPDSVLEFGWQSEDGYGNFATYLLALYDVQGRTVVWKAQISLKLLWSSGTVLAATTINQMKKDGLIDLSCMAPNV